MDKSQVSRTSILPSCRGCEQSSGGQRDSLERAAMECLGLVWCGVTLKWPVECDVWIRRGNNLPREQCEQASGRETTGSGNEQVMVAAGPFLIFTATHEFIC